jgi:hypothetical protein
MMNRCARTTLVAGISELALGILAPSARALSPEPSGASGTVTIWYTLKATGTTETLDFDGMGVTTTIIDQPAELTCPVETYGVDPVSCIDGASAGHAGATAQLGRAAEEEVAAIDPSTVTAMEALEKEFKACKKSGKSEEACGMAMMAKMSADPEMMAAMGAMGMADPEGMADAEAAVAANAGQHQVWFSERCDGTMTVNNSTVTVSASGETTVGEKITGTRAVIGESNITVETDLNASSSRYVILPADADGFKREGADGSGTSRVAVIPETIVAGPHPGPIKDGRYEADVPGGKLTIDWTFQRKR